MQRVAPRTTLEIAASTGIRVLLTDDDGEVKGEHVVVDDARPMSESATVAKCPLIARGAVSAHRPNMGEVHHPRVTAIPPYFPDSIVSAGAQICLVGGTALTTG